MMGDNTKLEFTSDVVDPVFTISQSQDANTPGTIEFHVGGVESDPVMTLSSEGMTYKGKLIEDAGEAHKAFTSVMKMMREKIDRNET